MVFLKLDFSKAYDMVDWRFLFRAMRALGLPDEFIDMTELLLLDATANVKVKGSESPSFSISRGVRQGCPLAPFLFFIVAEVLNAMVKNEVRRGAVRGITLPAPGCEQVVAQYADDTSFSLRGGGIVCHCLCSNFGFLILRLRTCAQLAQVMWILEGGKG